MIYKVSYVMLGERHPGIIRNQGHKPCVGERLQFGDQCFEIKEVKELLPPQGEFVYLHVTCKLVPPHPI